MLRPSDHVRTLTVRISDPAPGAEKFLSGFVAAAWPSLARLSPLPAEPSWAALSFHAEPEAALAGAEFVQENAPEREDLKRLAGPARCRPRPGDRHRVEFVRAIDEPSADRLPPPRTLRHRPPVQSAASGAFGRGGRQRESRPRGCRAGARLLHRDRQAADSHPPRGSGHVANRLQPALWREAVHLVAERVASVADVDTAISAGSGLRWALMGPHLTFHLAGGVGGIDHFLDQFATPMASWWESLGNPALTPELRQRLAHGIADVAAGRDIDELEARRDRFLVDLLALKAARE